MSKLLGSVLDKISEDNNEYRVELRVLGDKLDERTTTMIGDVVTASGYAVDFSNTVSGAKDELVNPIKRIVEQYVIKDLRSVETVNEQFIDKINDKLEDENVNTEEEKKLFNKNLNTLLNEKYLEIIKIKRTSFTDEHGVNADVEKTVDDFITSITNNVAIDTARLNEIVSHYKADVYNLVNDQLSKISNLYLNNFVNEISSALEVNDEVSFDNNTEPLNYDRPFIPDINPVPQIDVPLSTPSNDITDETKPPVIPDITMNISPDLDVPVKEELNKDQNPTTQTTEMDVNVPPINEVKEQSYEEKPKKTYDVEEILKIAKSPVVTPFDPVDNNDSFVNVEPINITEDNNLDSEFEAREIVEEMIKRLTQRLEKIDQRKNKYESNLNKLKEDEGFVNDLITSSEEKKKELDEFEKELDKKEDELTVKQNELDKKINNIMPFAQAVMQTSEKES